MDYLEQHNANPKPFVWTASAGAILEKVARANGPVEISTLEAHTHLCSIQATRRAGRLPFAFDNRRYPRPYCTSPPVCWWRT